MLNYDSENKCQELTEILKVNFPFSLNVEQILAFTSSLNMVREVKISLPSRSYSYIDFIAKL